MGQEQIKSEEVVQLIHHSTAYQLDIRLIEAISSLPTYFSASIQRNIEEIQHLASKIPVHPIQSYLINAIDSRFSKKNTVNMEAVSAGRSSIEFLSIDESKFEHKYWFELENKQRFLRILTLLQGHYEIEVTIQKEFQKAERFDSKYQPSFSLRKQIKPPVSIKMDQELIMRMFFHYYVVNIKTYANSGEKHIYKFHEETGRQLCLLIFHGHLNLEELYELFYYMVFIDKHPKQIISKLSTINRLYHSKCLQTYYSIHVEKKRLQSLQTTARLYLDELYMNSVREAEDPEIKNTDDTLMPIKVFPISRVKDKPKVS